MKDSILTLENYVERYIPMVILKTVKDLVSPVLDEIKLEKFEKVFERNYFFLSKSIVED